MEAREKWNGLADSFQKTAGIRGEYDNRLYEYLRRKGAVIPGERVADIGCGAGKNAVFFAREGMKVLLIDISDRMLNYSKANLGDMADTCEFFEGVFEQTDLKKLGWEKYVHLSFAAMTPAVGSREGIERMCRMSCSGCMITTFADRTECLAQDIAGIAGLELPGQDTDSSFLRCVETVRSLGYSPEVSLIEYNWQNELAPSEAAERFFNGRIMELDKTQDNRLMISRALEKLTKEDGYITEKVLSHAAWIWWEV